MNRNEKNKQKIQNKTYRNHKQTGNRLSRKHTMSKAIEKCVDFMVRWLEKKTKRNAHCTITQSSHRTLKLKTQMNDWVFRDKDELKLLDWKRASWKFNIFITAGEGKAHTCFQKFSTDNFYQQVDGTLWKLPQGKFIWYTHGNVRWAETPDNNLPPPAPPCDNSPGVTAPASFGGDITKYEHKTVKTWPLNSFKLETKADISPKNIDFFETELWSTSSSITTTKTRNLPHNS